MNISYKTDNVVLANDVESYTEEKLAAVRKLFAHYADEDISCEVHLAKDEKHQSGSIYRADFTILAGSERVHGVGHGETMQAALDAAKDEIMGRTRREKKMHRSFLRKSGEALKNMMRWGN